MKVTIDIENCIGCGVCVSLVPDVFELGDDGKAHVIAGKENNFDESQVKNAADQCPVQVIKVE
jgi:ferredoxin